MRVENIQTFAKFHAPSRAPSGFASPSMTVGERHVINLVTDVGKAQSKLVAFDRVIQDDCELSSVYGQMVTDATLEQLLEGFGLGVFRVDGGGEAGPDRLALFTSVIPRLEALLNGKNVSVSFGLYSVTDLHCVDMRTFDQIEMESIKEIVKPSTYLDASTSFTEVLECLEKGYTGACVLLVRLRHERAASVTVSTLCLGDLSCGSERSLQQLRNCALSLDQPFASSGSCVPFDQSRLTSLLEPFIGGSYASRFLFCLAQHPAGVEAKSLASTLALAEALRRVKCRPEPFYEPAEVRELARLLLASEELKTSQLAAQQQVKGLKKDLARLNGERVRLTDDAEMSSSLGEVARWEAEYRMAQLNLGNIELHDQLRQAEAKLLWMEHQKTVLDSAVFELRYACHQGAEDVAYERQIQQMQEEEYEAKLEELEANLESSTREMNSVIERLEKDALAKAKQHESRVSQLEAKLSQAEAKRIRLEADSEEQRKRWEQDKRELTEQEKRASAQASEAIAQAKADEAKLKEELKEMAADGKRAKSTIEDLEKEIGRLRIENAALGAKLDIYTRFGPQQQQQPTKEEPKPKPAESPKRKSDTQVKQALAKMEERFGQERAQMFSMLESIKASSKPAPLPAEKARPAAKVPAKRGKKQVAEMSGPENDSDSEAGQTEEIKVPPPVKKQIKLKPKAEPAPQPAKDNKLPAPQLFVKRTDALSAVPKTSAHTSEATTKGPEASPIKTKSTFNPALPAKPRFLANLSFESGSVATGGDRRRIKLPERTATGAGLAPSNPEGASTKRNIDPAVYSAILSGFTIDK